MVSQVSRTGGVGGPDFGGVNGIPLEAKARIEANSATTIAGGKGLNNAGARFPLAFIAYAGMGKSKA